MCLIVFAWRAHPEFDLVVGANRDEFYARPSAPAATWDGTPGLIAGRDLQAGGTWLGVTSGGRFAALTNYRDPGAVRPDARSRGELVQAFLQTEIPAATFAGQAWAVRGLYNGFNLVLGDGESLWYVGSRDDGGPRAVEPGVHGLSNHLLDSPWPKVEASRTRLAEALGQVDPEPHVFALLDDRRHAPDDTLPDTGVGLDWERALSPPFIVTERYGTRSSTFLAQRGSRLRLVERSFGPGGVAIGEVRHER